MSVIAKQSALNSIVRFVGVFLGTINVLLIYTLCFSEEQIGQLRYIQETAILLTTFFSLGVGNLTVRYFPVFRSDDTKHNGFFSLLLFVNLIGMLLFILFVGIIPFFGSEALSENTMAISIVLACMMFLNLFTAYASNFQKIVVPELFNNILIKVGLPMLALLLYFNNIVFDQVIVGLEWVYVIAAVGLFIYMLKLGITEFSFSSIRKPMATWTDMRSYMIFGLLGGVGSVFASRIDIVMITEYFSYKETGIYTIALFIASVVAIPMNSLRAITGPIIAQKIKDDKLSDVGNIYKKSSVNLFLLGSIFFLLILSNLDDLFGLMPNGDKYVSGSIVVVVIAVGKLFDLLTSVNGEIILYSKYYKYTTYFILIMSIMNVLANFLLIPKYNILGAAFATLISLFIYNLIKLWFIHAKMGIHPFSRQTIQLFAIGIGVALILWVMPMPDMKILAIGIRSAIILVAYLLSVLYLNISEDALILMKKIMRKVK